MIDLIDRRTKNGGQHEDADLFHRRMPQAGPYPEPDAMLDQIRQLQGQLKDPAQQHPAGQPHDLNRFGIRKPGNGKNGADHGQVQQDRRDGRGREMTQHIENTHAQGHQSDKGYIGKHDTRQCDGQAHLLRQVGKPGGDRLNEGWRSDHANDRYDRQADQQQFQGAHGQAKSILAPPLEQGFRENGHKGNAQRPLTEQAAQQVGNPKGGNKGIRRHPGTKKRSQYHIP